MQVPLNRFACSNGGSSSHDGSNHKTQTNSDRYIYFSPMDKSKLRTFASIHFDFSFLVSNVHEIRMLNVGE